MRRPDDPFQVEVARLALEVTARYGFAVGGGHALAAHGIIHRPTEDVDLFTDTVGAVPAAASDVTVALTAAGYTVSRTAQSELAGVFDGFDQDLVDLLVVRGDHAMRLTLARFDRNHSPVTLKIGPVLHIDDVIGSKVAALATRAEVRDYIDVAALLARFSRAELVELAHQTDPALTEEEFVEAADRLGEIEDAMLARYGLDAAGIAALRAAFAPWPRSR